MPIHLPRDLWLDIGSFLPQAQLATLLSVNSAFLELAISSTYRTIAVHGERILLRLQDPFVAWRVQGVLLSSKFLKGVDKGTINGTLLSQTIRDFPNLRRLAIECRPGLFPTTLYTGVLEVVGLRLESLELFISKAALPSWVAASTGNLPRLAALRITLFPDAAHTPRSHIDVEAVHKQHPDDISDASSEEEDLYDDWSDEAVVFRDHLGPFIHGLRMSLSSLAIHSPGQDPSISMILATIGHLPRLKGLTLAVPFTSCGLLNPDSLTRVLSAHADTLRRIDFSELEWDYEQEFGPEGSSRGRRLQHDERQLEYIEWLQSAIRAPDATMPCRLQTLKMCIPSTRQGVQALALLLARSSETLEEVTLYSYVDYLSIDDVGIIVDALSCASRLVELAIRVDTLTPGLFKLLAAALPSLSRLSLEVRLISDAEQEPQDPAFDSGEIQVSTAFLLAITRQPVLCWSLQELRLLGVGDATEDFVHALVTWIPSLRSVTA